MPNIVDPDQTAPQAVWSGSALLAYANLVRSFGVWNFRTFTVLWIDTGNKVKQLNNPYIINIKAIC